MTRITKNFGKTAVLKTSLFASYRGTQIINRKLLLLAELLLPKLLAESQIVGDKTTISCHDSQEDTISEVGLF